MSDRSCKLLAAAIVFGLVLPHFASAENWPGWRGPRGDGTSQEANVPTQWNGPTGENIAWKAEIPGSGHSSPIVWDDRVSFVRVSEAASDTKSERGPLCLDRRTGKIVWQTDGARPRRWKRSTRSNSFASGTPATDGKLVYVDFLEVGGHTSPRPTSARRGRSRRARWSSRPTISTASKVAGRSRAGSPARTAIAARPVLFEDMVIVNGDHDGDALHRGPRASRPARRVWKIARENKTRSYVTPIIREIAGRTQMLLSGSKCVASYDPRDRQAALDRSTARPSSSSPRWSTTASCCSSPPAFPSSTSWRSGPTARATSPTRTSPGDTTEGGSLRPLADRGRRLLSGRRRRRHRQLLRRRDRRAAVDRARSGKHFSASLVTAGGLVYFLADDGTTNVVRPGHEVRRRGREPAGRILLRLAGDHRGQLFIRGEKHLYCIGE